MGVWLDPPKTQKCTRCKTEKPLSDFNKDSSRGSGYSYTCRECMSFFSKKENYRKQYKQRLFAQVLEAYGAECACCGENNRLFLTVDHINNDGADHRREMGWKRGNRYQLSSTDMHCWLRQNGYPDTFQILCYNCNCGKARTGGTCPHEAE